MLIDVASARLAVTFLHFISFPAFTKEEAYCLLYAAAAAAAYWKL